MQNLKKKNIFQLHLLVRGRPHWTRWAGEEDLTSVILSALEALCDYALYKYTFTSSMRGLTTSWNILLQRLLLSVVLNIISNSISLHWITLSNHVVFGLPHFFFPDNVPGLCPSLNNCVSWYDQNSVISLSYHLLTKFLSLQLLPESIHWFSCCPWDSYYLS